MNEYALELKHEVAENTPNVRRVFLHKLKQSPVAGFSDMEYFNTSKRFSALEPVKRIANISIFGCFRTCLLFKQS